MNFKKPTSSNKLNRRSFLVKSGAAVIAGTMIPASKAGASMKASREVNLRTLGRTGFEVYPVAIGGFCQNPNVFKRAMDLGVNHIDTAEKYYLGNSERTVGKAIGERDRKTIFITTKLKVDPDDSGESLVNRYRKCLERLGSDYCDALYIHGIGRSLLVEHEGFHAAVGQLKSEGRLKHAGISSHGPEEVGEDTFEKILMAAVNDGRFDLMLFNYNFMNKEVAGRVIRACKEKKLGTIAMKTSPGIESPLGGDEPLAELDPVDPGNLTEAHEDFISEMMDKGPVRGTGEGMTREKALEVLIAVIERYNENLREIGPYIEKYGATSSEELRRISLKWVLENPDVHTVAMSMDSFSEVDAFVPLAGTELTMDERQMIRDYSLAFDNRYCRHGCSDCVGSCPHKLPVSRIMRYTYYFRLQGREKYAMSRYQTLAGRNAHLCWNCDAPCREACPHGINIQAGLLKAHQTLTLA